MVLSQGQHTRNDPLLSTHPEERVGADRRAGLAHTCGHTHAALPMSAVPHPYCVDHTYQKHTNHLTQLARRAVSVHNPQHAWMLEPPSPAGALRNSKALLPCRPHLQCSIQCRQTLSCQPQQPLSHHPHG
jgi:hypothetical protein